MDDIRKIYRKRQKARKRKEKIDKEVIFFTLIIISAIIFCLLYSTFFKIIEWEINNLGVVIIFLLICLNIQIVHYVNYCLENNLPIINDDERLAVHIVMIFSYTIWVHFVFGLDLLLTLVISLVVITNILVRITEWYLGKKSSDSSILGLKRI